MRGKRLQPGDPVTYVDRDGIQHKANVWALSQVPGEEPKLTVRYLLNGGTPKAPAWQLMIQVGVGDVTTSAEKRGYWKPVGGS